MARHRRGASRGSEVRVGLGLGSGWDEFLTELLRARGPGQHSNAFFIDAMWSLLTDGGEERVARILPDGVKVGMRRTGAGLRERRVLGVVVTARTGCRVRVGGACLCGRLWLLPHEASFMAGRVAVPRPTLLRHSLHSAAMPEREGGREKAGC